MNKGCKNLLLFFAVVLLAAAPLMYYRDAAFTGSDEQAQKAVGEIRSDYQPWVKPVWVPPGGAAETFLFAAQAAAGGGVLGYLLGYVKGKKNGSKRHVFH